MADQQTSGAPLSDDELQDLVASSDTGARNPGGGVAKLLAGIALAWSVFQLWIASPLPFMVTDLIPVLNNTETRSIHLAFAIFLAFMAYPALKRSPRDRVPLQDWVFAIVGAYAAGYLFLFYGELSDRPGAPIEMDLWIAGIGMVALLEATRRALGPPLMIVALVFLGYVFFGDSTVIPDAIRWKGASFAKAMGHQWLTTEGVYGIALGVSTSFVFLFVLFGSLLDKAGAGNYFIKVAFSLLGHLRGGPAKAAVLASAMTGLISGSSIANVVTTGTFTIPLMKRVGFTPEQAGSVEVASSVNGQIMPPVMGAAAFLMVEYVGISYLEVITHAFLPAVISYIALLYIVHLEALKNEMEGLPKPGVQKTAMARIAGALIPMLSILILCGVVYYGIQGIKMVTGDFVGWILALVVFVIYIALIAFAARSEDLEMDDPNAELVSLPEFGPTFRTGLHYILPIVVLVWFLMIERKSPGLSAFWASALMLIILITQRPLKAMFRKTGDAAAAFRLGWADMLDGMIAGARNMIGIGVATAAAGIIVGTVTLTGIGQVMTEFVEILSGGNLIIMLILIAFTLFRPGFWLDQVQAPFASADPKNLEQVAAAQPDNVEMRIFVSGQNAGGDDVETTVVLPLGPKGTGAARLEAAGIKIIQKDGKTIIDDVVQADAKGKPTAAVIAKLEFDMEILSAEVPQERMPKQLFYIPALLFLIVVWGLQRRRVPAKNTQSAAV